MKKTLIILLCSVLIGLGFVAYFDTHFDTEKASSEKPSTDPTAGRKPSSETTTTNTYLRADPAAEPASTRPSSCSTMASPSSTQPRTPDSEPPSTPNSPSPTSKRRHPDRRHRTGQPDRNRIPLPQLHHIRPQIPCPPQQTARPCGTPLHTVGGTLHHHPPGRCIHRTHTPPEAPLLRRTVPILHR